MNLPRYRVGETVCLPSSLLDGIYRPDTIVRGKILFPREDGSYLVRINDLEGYAVVEDYDIIDTIPEYDQTKPVYRKNIRIVFFGNGQFALPTLKMLVAQGYDVAAVVTMEDKPCGRSKAPRPSVVKIFAENAGIPVFQPKKLDSQRFLQHIRDLHATIGVVVEFRKLPKVLYTIPQWGTLNLHSSLLPMYRGASTIASAIKHGDTMTGVTTFMVNDNIDDGGIINNYAVIISEYDNAASVFIKLKLTGSAMVDDAIQRIAHSCRLVPQTELICDFIQPSYAPKLHREDCRIPWYKSATYVHNFIRAHSPIPSAWTILELLGTTKPVDLKIFTTEKTAIPRGIHAPGELFVQERKLYIACGDELLRVLDLQMPNRRRMAASEFINGHHGACKGFCDLSLPSIEDCRFKHKSKAHHTSIV